MLIHPASTSASSDEPISTAGKTHRSLPACIRRPWLPAKLRRSWREFNEHLTHDQAFADAISRRLDICAAIFLFVSYTLTAILIFAINGSIYGDNT